MLEGRVVGPPEGMAHRERHQEGAWRIHFLGYFPQEGNTDRGNAGFLNHTRDQPDGLNTNGSGRNEQDRIDRVSAEHVR